MSAAFFIRDRDPSERRRSYGRCVYCDTAEYRDRNDRKLGDEHIIPESLGGTLILEQSACEACERAINEFEQPILKSVLYAPRVHLGVRRKRRKRGDEKIKLRGVVNGSEVDVYLPIKRAPVLLYFLRLGPPGILVGRPSDVADIAGAWVSHLAGPVVPQGFRSMASPVLDTYKFSQFLAKIAHSYAALHLRDGFEPLLLDIIRRPAESQRYDLIGGERDVSPASGNLHELELHWRKLPQANVVTVKIRLFANLGAPTFWVVAGKSR